MAKIYCKSSYLLRKDTAENWGSKNPVLRKGEQGLETDTGIMKIGDGTTAFNNLPDDNIYFPKSYVNNNFANALKGTASGAAVSLTDVSPNEHTLGVKVRGKNLIPYPYTGTSSTMFGVTFTVNSDGSITVNGTATANVVFELETDATMFTLPAGNYFLSGCPSGGSPTSYFMVAVNGAGITYDKSQRDFGNGISVPSKGEKWKISIRIISGYTADNLVFKPQIELGSTATAYTPYTSDLTTITVTRCGKNLFDKSIPISSYISLDTSYKYLKYYVGTGTNVTVSIAEKPTVPNNNGFMYVYPNATPKPDGNAKWLAHQTVNALCSKQQTVVSTDGYICLVVSVNKVLDYYGNSIQIELGTTATEYEPYKMPTEYTPAADGTVSGVKSLYPTTTLMTDTEGAIIEAEYNRDINKAFAELQQAILSMGGNT